MSMLIVVFSLMHGRVRGARALLSWLKQPRIFSLSYQMQLEGDLEIMRAHQTNIRRQSTAEGTASLLPRPVHVYLLRYTDKQYILRKAASALKDNPFLEANPYNSDDVSKKVRDNWKKLKERYINETHFREEVDFTLHPLEWTCANSLQSWRFGETKISLLARSMNMYVPFNIFIFILIFFLKLFPCYAVAYLVVY